MKTALLVVLCMGWIGCALEDGVDLDVESDEIQSEGSVDTSESEELEDNFLEEQRCPHCRPMGPVPCCPAAAEPPPADLCSECAAGVPPPPGYTCCS